MQANAATVTKERAIESSAWIGKDKRRDVVTVRKLREM